MKSRMRYLGIGGGLVAVALLWAVTAAPFAPQAQAQEEEESVLHQAMEELNTGYRSLRRLARRGNWDADAAETVSDMTKAAVVCMRETPPMAETVPTEERDEFIIAYKKMSGDVIKELVDLEIAILENREDDIMDHLIALRDLEVEGHEQFRED